MITKCLGCGKYEYPAIIFRFGFIQIKIIRWKKQNPDPENSDRWYDSGYCLKCIKKEMKRVKKYEI